MTDFLSSPVGMALLAGCCTWAFTAFGAGMVYTAKSFSRRTLDVMLGFAAGVMVAASYWSLLAPRTGDEFPISAGWPVFPCAGLSCRGGGIASGRLHPAAHPSYGKRPRRPAFKVAPQRLARVCHYLAQYSRRARRGRSVWGGGLRRSRSQHCRGDDLDVRHGAANIPEGVAVSVPLLREGFSKIAPSSLGSFPASSNL